MDAPSASHLTRVRLGVRKLRNWQQLLRFGCVGASGYVVNLAVFALCLGVAGLGHRPAAVAAFCVAVANNFAWNRRWTFSGAGNRLRQQATRFLAMAVLAFLAALGILEVLVAAGVGALLAQAVSIVCATPLNFVGNKIWTFAAP